MVAVANIVSHLGEKNDHEYERPSVVYMITMLCSLAFLAYLLFVELLD